MMQARVDTSAVIGINLNPNRGFRRGEGGWVDAGWAFMVARSPSLDGLLWPAGASPLKAGDHQEHRISHFFRRNILLVSPLLISSTRECRRP